VHINSRWLRNLYRKYATTSEYNPDIALLSVNDCEKMLSNVDELLDNVCWLELINLNFDKSVISPKQVAIM
jgi:hypothetical protein